VVPLEEAEVATRMAGTIDRVAVRVGDRVARGDLIASLDAADVNARIDAARAQLELALRTHQRIANLERDGAASTQELDQVVAQLRSAEAMVKEAEAHASYVDIRAPFSGTITARMADAGDMAAPGSPLVRLSGAGVKVVAELPSSLSGSIVAGQSVTLDTDHGRIDGTVTQVSPALDRASRRFQVEVVPASSERLLPGSFLRLTIAEAEGATRWVPSDAIVRNGQLTGVFTVEGDTLRLRWLRLGRTSAGAEEVLAGPPGDMMVVRNPSAELRDGQPVSSVTRADAPALEG
jgi:RND family efflux transporter MFP subunit